MNYRIWEDVNDFRKHLLHQFVSLIQCHVQRPHISTTEGTCNIFILRSFAPTRCMTRSIKLGNHSDPPHHRISYKLPCICSRIGFLGTKRSMLSNLGMRIKNQWEGVLISDMPMKNVQFIIHHGVDRFIKQVYGKEMSGSINHQAPVDKLRLILDCYWYSFLNAFFIFVFWTLEGL